MARDHESDVGRCRRAANVLQIETLGRFEVELESWNTARERPMASSILMFDLGAVEGAATLHPLCKPPLRSSASSQAHGWPASQTPSSPN